MALSEEEQRLLSQLEASWAAEDPRFAAKLSGKPVRRANKRRATVAGIGFLVGVGLLIAGMQTTWVLSVLGFVLMFASAVLIITSWQQVPADGQHAAKQRGEPDFLNRMEDRWQRRQQEGRQ